MKRDAFTLMEMLVSVVIIVLITLFMYGAIASSRLTSRTLGHHAAVENNRTMLYELLYRDIIEALKVEPLPTQNRRFTIVNLQTRNSLYDIAAPHVVWYVNAQSRKLIRMESSLPISLPVRFEQKTFIHADAFASSVTDFNLYAVQTTEKNATNTQEQNTSMENNSSKEDNSTQYDHFLLYMNTENKPNIMLELAL